MLVNGVEVFEDRDISIEQAYKVQKMLNKMPEVKSDSKASNQVTLSNGDINLVSPNLTTWQSFTPGTFENQGSTEKKRSVLSRTQLYETYIKMDATEFLHRGLEVIADESSQKDDDENVIQIQSNNEKIKEDLEDFFLQTLGFDIELWSIVYETAKMGDNYYEVVLEIGDGKAYGIKRLKYIDPSKIEIKEREGKVDYYIYKYRSSNDGGKLTEQKLFPWQLIHFKIEDKENKPYGRSLFYSGVRTFTRLMNTEDIFLTYVISRTPSRRLFKIDVGNKPPLEVQREMQAIRDSYRSQQVIDDNGELNRTSAMFSITSDLFIPVREGSTGTSVEMLGGEGLNMGQNLTFIDYFKSNLLRTMNIPPEYLGENSATDKSTSLAQRDVKFGRFIERVQNHVLKGIYKLATLQLFFLGYTKEDLQDFTITLTPPSTIKELSDVDVITQKITLLGNMQSLNIFPTTWLLKTVLKLSDKEINDIQFLKSIEMKQEQMQGQQGQQGGGLMGGGGGIDMSQGGMDPGAVPGEEPGLEGGEQPAENPEDLANALSTGMEPPSGVEMPEQALFNVLGKDYIVENKQDMVVLLKYLKDDEKMKRRKQKPSEFITEVTNFINNKTKRDSAVSIKNPYDFLEISNEFSGLEMNRVRRGKGYSIYEGKKIAKKEVRNLLNE